MIFEFFQEMLKKFILRVHVNELGLVLFWKKNVNLNWTTDYQSPNDIVKVDMTHFEIISNIGKQSYGQFDIIYINQDIG